MSLPADLGVPRYGRDTLADVLPGVATALGAGIERDGLPPDPLRLTEALAGARRVAVLLVDGLGADLLRAHSDLAPALAALHSPVGELSAPCPSTTPVSLTTLGTGLPPGAHGVLGFVTAVPGEDRTVNHVQWTDPDPRAWQARTTVFEQAAAAARVMGGRRAGAARWPRRGRARSRRERAPGCGRRRDPRPRPRRAGR